MGLALGLVCVLPFTALAGGQVGAPSVMSFAAIGRRDDVFACERLISARPCCRRFEPATTSQGLR